jgi:aspartyl-tRNA(Asn)/glutamyl-tRNA(Gln) amidotransferase subunit A
MTENDLPQLTIAHAAEWIRERRLSPVELTRLYLARIDKLNPILNAYQTLTAEAALADAATAEKEINAGKYRGALHGVPVSIKDNLATRGIKTTAGSQILADWVPDFDATVVARLKAAGAISLGKTNMHEWAAGGTTINPYFGATYNPWDLARIPGGSSGGSAAAVAADLCLASIGTDNAGSVRNPAAMCGVVGLKPTYGRVSVFGGVPGTGGYSTNHFGVFSKTVEDSALVLQAIAGKDDKDPLSSAAPVANYSTNLRTAVTGKKFGLVANYFDDFLTGESERLFKQAIESLEALGMKAERVTIPHASLIPAVQMATSRVENASAHEEYLRSRPRDYSPDILYRHIHALTIPATTYIAAQKVRRVLCQEFAAAFESVNVIVTPVSIPAPTLEECRQGFAIVDGKKMTFQDIRGSYWGLSTIPFNVTGLPAICVCCGFTAAGLPLAIQIAGSPFDEAGVLQVAHAYEQRHRWGDRKPRLQE